MIELAFVALTLFAPLQSALTHEGTTTLYSVHKHRGQNRQLCVNFQSSDQKTPKKCDVRYGSLYVGDYLDWFESSAAGTSRSVIKDLGAKTWNDQFTVPVVEPLAKLQPGEQRRVTIDSSGADGADGEDGSSGAASTRPFVLDSRSDNDIARAGGPLPRLFNTDSNHGADLKKKAKAREPKVDPMFVKAVAGHMYVIHVVDEARDFYVIFRVDSIERGDNCTISWRLISSPVAASVKQED